MGIVVTGGGKEGAGIGAEGIPRAYQGPRGAKVAGGFGERQGRGGGRGWVDSITPLTEDGPFLCRTSGGKSYV